MLLVRMGRRKLKSETHGDANYMNKTFLNKQRKVKTKQNKTPNKSTIGAITIKGI